MEDQTRSLEPKRRFSNTAEDGLARVQYDLDNVLYGWQMPGARDTVEEQRLYKTEGDDGMLEYDWRKLPR